MPNAAWLLIRHCNEQQLENFVSFINLSAPWLVASFYAAAVPVQPSAFITFAVISHSFEMFFFYNQRPFLCFAAVSTGTAAGLRLSAEGFQPRSC